MRYRYALKLDNRDEVIVREGKNRYIGTVLGKPFVNYQTREVFVIVDLGSSVLWNVHHKNLE